MTEQNPIEESLGRIETSIRQLKTQYDMFFAGAMPRQPYEVRKELETLINVIGNTKMQRFADRYRFNSLATKYQSMVELWNKMIRAKEEGRLRPGVPGFVEPVRRRPVDPTPPPVPAAKLLPGDRFTIKEAGAQDPSLRLFYDKFLQASQQSGAARGSAVSFETFARQIGRKTAAMRVKSGCDAVSFSIVVKEGGVTLKANPAGKGEGEKK